MTSKSPLFHARTWLAIALIAVGLSPVQAESTRRVRIDLSGACSFHGDTIQVVLGGDETLQFPAVRKSPDTFWTGEWPHPQRDKTFNAADAFASLRLAGARTDCRTSYPMEEDTRWIAAFTFDCAKQSVQEIVVHTEPENLPVTFVREVLKIGKPTSRDCTEYGMFPYGSGTIADVHFATESVRLQAGLNEPEPKRPGLLIDDEAVLKHANREGQVQFTLDTFLDALAEQRAKGKLSSSPSLSDNARKLEKERLQTLEKLELKGLQRKAR